MKLPTKLGRYLGLAAAAAIGFALVQVGSAGASPYAHWSAVVADGTLRITGTNASDDLSVVFTADGTAAQVVIGDGAQTRSFDRSTFTKVTAILAGGDDQFHVFGNPAADPSVSVYGGSGADTAVGGSGPDILVGGSGADDLRGGAGVDVLYGNRGDDVLDGGVGADVEFLGSGADTALWVPGEGSDAVRGGYGADRLVFVGSSVPEVMTLTSSGNQAVLTRDPGTIRMDLESVEDVELKPLAGADLITVNGTDRPESVDVRADDGSVDVTGLFPSVTLDGVELADRLQLNTLGGRDRVNVQPGVSALIGIAVDLGTGQ